MTVQSLDKQGRISREPLQTIPTAEKAHGVAIDSKDRFVFVPHTGGNRIHQFAFNRDRGRLTALDPPFVARPKGEHPRHIVMHPSDRWAYTSNEAGDSLGVYSVDTKTGRLKSLQTLSSLPADFNKGANATARCEMSPDGRFVYVANRGHESIACYAVNQKTGRATSLGQVPTEKTPRSFTIDPTGRYLYAAGESSGTNRVVPNSRRRAARAICNRRSWAGGMVGDRGGHAAAKVSRAGENLVTRFVVSSWPPSAPSRRARP